MPEKDTFSLTRPVSVRVRTAEPEYFAKYVEDIEKAVETINRAVYSIKQLQYEAFAEVENEEVPQD
jgi:hypothetical protein